MTMTIAKTMTVLGTTLAMSGAALGQDWVQRNRLTQTDAQLGDNFGFELAIDGDTILIGSALDDTLLLDEGSASVFVRDGAVWREQAMLFSSDPAMENNFGWSVDLDGDRAVVSEWRGDGAEFDSGCVYVFERSGEEWRQTARLFSADGESDDWFGASVAIDGNLIAVGAPGSGDAGEVHVFEFDGTRWGPAQVLTPRDTASTMLFGWAVALDGTTLVASDIQGGSFTGAAFVFERAGDAFEEQATLIGDGLRTADEFGTHVAIDGDLILVGAIRAFMDSPLRGRAFAFRRDGDDWVQDAEFETSSGDRSETFGSVSIEGNLAVIGAQNYNRELPSAGRAYVFERMASGWVLRDLLTPRVPSSVALFGNSVAVSGRSIAIAAALEDSPADRAGAAYVFEPNPCPADLDGDGELTIFDFLEFQNLFDAGDPVADFDGDGELTLFDFLAFQNAFDAGC